MRAVPALVVILLTPIRPSPPVVDQTPAIVPASVDAVGRAVPTRARLAPPDVHLRPSVSIVGGDESDRSQLHEALARFREADLHLPDVEVRFSDDDADCRGHLGLFESSRRPWRVSICSDLAFVPYHELAHAWEAANVDDDTRAEYLSLRGLGNWNDPDAIWAERGVEDAAHVLQINLTTDRAPLSLPIWDERLEAYELLVGRPSPVVASSADAESDRRSREPDRTAGYPGGIAARLRSGRGVALPGDVFLLLATPGSDARARVFDRTPFEHDSGEHPDVLESNRRARRAAEDLVGHAVDRRELTTPPGGGPSGGLAYLVGYLNLVTDGGFTGDRRVAATGALADEGYLSPVRGVNEKLAAAGLADVDVLFTTSAPSHVALEAHADRIVGRRVMTRVGRVDLDHERGLAQYREWGATAPNGLDVVHVGHLADVAAYLCGTGSAPACEVTERLGPIVTSDEPTGPAGPTTLPTSGARQPNGSVS